MATRNWDLIFKGCGAVAAIVSAIGLVAGGIFGLYTYREQGIAADAARQKELRLMQYSQKKDIYYELVDAASTFASSTTKAEAEKNAARYNALYFGRAHIFAIDPKVNASKIAFHAALEAALARGNFPTKDLDDDVLALADACKRYLAVEDVLGVSKPS